MKRPNLIRRLTAALVAGAMALSLSAPALAAADDPAPALQPGTYPEGSIAVIYADKDRAIVVSGDTADILGDGTLAYADGVLSSTKTIEGLLIDVNPEKTVDIDISVADGPAVEDQLVVQNARSVTLSGYAPDGAAVNTVYANCTGGLTVKNTAAQGDAAEEVKFYNQSGSEEMVLRLADNFEGVIAPGRTYEYKRTDGPITIQTSSIAINAEPTYTLTVENGYAVSDHTGQASTRFYRGEFVTVYMERPADALELDSWVLPEGLHLSEEDRKMGVCTFYMPEKDITVGASWKKADNEEIALAVTYGNDTEVFTPATLAEDDPVASFANGTFTIHYEYALEDKDLLIRGLADPRTGAVPSVVLDGYVISDLYADGVEDLTVQMPEQYSGTLVDGSVDVSVSGDVKLLNTKGDCVGDDLIVRSARNVTVSANTANYGADYGEYAIEDDAEIRCSGDVTITNADGGAISGDLFVYNAQNVLVRADEADCCLIDGDAGAEITCTGNVDIISPSDNGVCGNLTVHAAQDVTVQTDDEDGYAVSEKTDITCTGDVTLCNPKGVAVEYPLTIAGARNVTITGKTDGDELIGYYDDEEHSIQCSGTVTLRNEGSGDLFTNQLTYTPDDRVEVYEIEVDGILERENATGPVVLTCGQSDIRRLSDTADPDDPDAPAEEWDNDLTGAKELVITPTLKPVDPGEAADGDGSAVVAVIAGTALGAAALYGGYEVATRVMLKDLLPEGAAIPATRGEFALLLWNAKGRPAPAAQPAFADVTDPDTAQAAQWCTEQGLFDASTDGIFAPATRMPKWRVIQLWKQAG